MNVDGRPVSGQSIARGGGGQRAWPSLDTAEAVQEADVIFLAVPDLKIAEVYEKDVAPHSHQGEERSCSATALPSISRRWCRRKDVDVIMVAPKGPGHIVRRQYVEGKGVPGADRRVPEPEQAGQENCPRLGQGHRRHARGRHRDEFQGGNGNRPLRRAGRALRRRDGADSGGLSRRWSKLATNPKWRTSNACTS